jgi:stress response protein SCP2
MSNVIEKVIVQVSVLEGKDLAPKSRNLLGKKTTSNPYCEIWKGTKDGLATAKSGTTTTQPKTLHPKWGNSTINETFVVEFFDKEYMKEPYLELQLWDEDKKKPGAMGTVKIPIEVNKSEKETKIIEWYEIDPDSAKKAKGQLHVLLEFTLVFAKSLIRGNEFPLQGDYIQVGLAWDMLPGRKGVDLDVSCVAISSDGGKVIMGETVYYGNVSNSNESVQHSGDEQVGDDDGDDEKISFELHRLPDTVYCMYIVLTVATPNMRIPDIESTTLKVYDTKKRTTLCKFTPASNKLSNDSTAMFMIRIARQKPVVAGEAKKKSKWILATIEDTHPTARDFGSLIPYMKSYTRDLIPDIAIDPTERVAIMRKGGNVRLSDYIKGGSLPSRMTFGLAWDVTDGVDIDLDASAVCFDSDLNVVDIICGKTGREAALSSADGAVVHHGDEQEGDEIGDDEKIDISLNRVSPKIKYIAFVINSYSGQELDDVDRASCHLFDPETGAEIVTYAMTNSESLDGFTALLVGCLYRAENSKEWCMCIISDASMGKVVQDNLEDLRSFLRKSPPQTPKGEGNPRMSSVIESKMPPVIPIAADEE